MHIPPLFPIAPASPLIADHLQTLEKELHQTTTRKSIPRLEQLLHPKFQEIGRSGKLYNKAHILFLLTNETSTHSVYSSHYTALQLNPSTILLTYRSHRCNNDGSHSHHTLRSSIWTQLTPADPWQMVFHQGTATEPPPP